MARIRTIKPDFFTSLTIADLTPEQRLTFIGLWTHADDEGRCIDDARLIKAAVWPLDDRSSRDVEDDLRALTEASLIARYTVRGRRYIAVATWDEHQRINRPTPSKFPSPDSGAPTAHEPLTCTDEGSETPPVVLTEGSVNTHDRKGTGKGTGNREELLPSPAAPSRTSEPHGFSDFWAQYPRKVGKDDAVKAYRSALKRTTSARIVLGARRLAADPNLPDKQFIPHPATWLNRGGWDDEPLPVRAVSGRPTTDDRVRDGLTLAARLVAEETAAFPQLGAAS